MADFTAAIPVTCGICKKAMPLSPTREAWYGLEMVHEKCGRKALAYDRHDRKRGVNVPGVKPNG